jgi:uncharacterized membrane protein (UPF0182 family)
LLIPVENSLLYVRPLYIEATGTTAVPELQLVIVGVGPEVVIADSFEAALASAIPGLNVDLKSDPAPPDLDDARPEEDDSLVEPDPRPEEDSDSDGMSVEELLALSREAFDRADAALRAGDLAGYQRWVEAAAGYISKAQQMLTQSPVRDDADAA